MAIQHLLIDIDSTLTESVQPDLHPEHWVDDNPWGPGHPLSGLRDIMVGQGWESDEATKRLLDYAEETIWWDYPDFIAAFGLPVEATWSALETWHRDHVTPYDDAAKMIRTLVARKDLSLYIMSNNPYCGCCLKLAVAGLADRYGSPHFTRIFGTNVLRGTKGVPSTWRRVFANLACAPETIATIGDNRTEDGRIPLEEGAGHAFLIDREQEEDIVRGEKTTTVNSLKQIPGLL